MVVGLGLGLGLRCLLRVGSMDGLGSGSAKMRRWVLW